MSRVLVGAGGRVGEEVQVEQGPSGPAQFWRGQTRYAVGELLDSWVETAPWWQADPAGGASALSEVRETSPASTDQYEGTRTSVAIMIARHFLRGESGPTPAGGDLRRRITRSALDGAAGESGDDAALEDQDEHDDGDRHDHRRRGDRRGRLLEL